MRYDARTEYWMPMEIKGVKGYFNDMRIDRSTVPDGFHMWELADGDSDGTPCRYKQGILANFYGTFITKGELPVDFPEYKEGFINTDKEWSFGGLANMTLEEILHDIP